MEAFMFLRLKAGLPKRKDAGWVAVFLKAAFLDLVPSNTS
jgi:hypothetical protein